MTQHLTFTCLITTTVLLLAELIPGHAQPTEPESKLVSSNDTLLYAPAVIARLQGIVDSLNAEFNRDGTVRTFHSLPQAHGISAWFSFRKDSNRIHALCSALDAGTPPEQIFKEFAISLVGSPKPMLIIKERTTTSYRLEPIIDFIAYGGCNGGAYLIHRPDTGDIFNQQGVRGRWLYDYDSGSTQINAVYMTDDFTSHPLLPEYNRLVRYIDHLVDTNTMVFVGRDSGRRGDPLPVKGPEVIQRLAQVYRLTGYRTPPAAPNLAWSQIVKAEMYGAMTDALRYSKDSLEQLQEHYDVQLSEWQEWYSRHVEEPVSESEELLTALRSAAAAAIADGMSDTELERLADLYLPKETRLELKRRQRIRGIGCATCDLGSRTFYLMDIATLSAETLQWNIFFRAHLGILDSRFVISDKGYFRRGWPTTYVRELEALGVDVEKLILGLSLSMSDPAQNHYGGAYSVSGRVIAESSCRDEIVERMIAMLRDERLDEYNRIRIAHLYIDLAKNIEDPVERATYITRLGDLVNQELEYRRPCIEDLESEE